MEKFKESIEHNFIPRNANLISIFGTDPMHTISASTRNRMHGGARASATFYKSPQKTLTRSWLGESQSSRSLGLRPQGIPTPMAPGATSTKHKGEKQTESPLVRRLRREYQQVYSSPLTVYKDRKKTPKGGYFDYTNLVNEIAERSEDADSTPLSTKALDEGNMNMGVKVMKKGRSITPQGEGRGPKNNHQVFKGGIRSGSLMLSPATTIKIPSPPKPRRADAWGDDDLWGDVEQENNLLQGNKTTHIPDIQNVENMDQTNDEQANYHMDLAIALGLINRYWNETRSYNSELLQFETMLARSRDDTKNLINRNTLLQTFVASVILERLPEVLPNYAHILIPVKDIIFKSLFTGYNPATPHKLVIKNGISTTHYNFYQGIPFYQLFKSYSTRHKIATLKVDFLSKKLTKQRNHELIIRQLVDKLIKKKQELRLKEMFKNWFMQTKRKPKAYWIQMWRSFSNTEDLVRKYFNNLHMYALKSRKNKLAFENNLNLKKVEKMKNKLSEAIIQKKVLENQYQDLLSEREKKSNLLKELGSKVKHLVTSKFAVDPYQLTASLNQMLKPFFQVTHLSGVIFDLKLELQRENQQFVNLMSFKCLDPPEEEEEKPRKKGKLRIVTPEVKEKPKVEISPMFKMRIHEILTIWVNYRIDLLMQKLKLFFKEKEYNNLESKSLTIMKEIMKESPKLAKNSHKIFSPIDDIFTATYSDGLLILGLLCSIPNPSTFTMFNFLRSFSKDTPQMRISKVYDELGQILEIKMERYLREIDLRLNNTQLIFPIVLLLFHLYPNIKNDNEEVELTDWIVNPDLSTKIFNFALPMLRSFRDDYSISDISWLLEKNEIIEDISQFGIEDILLRWINYIIRSYHQTLEQEEEADDIFLFREDNISGQESGDEGGSIRSAKSLGSGDEEKVVANKWYVHTFEELTYLNYMNLVIIIAMITPESLLDESMTMAIKEKNEINLNSIKERLLVMPTESRYLYLVNKALAITGIHGILKLEDLYGEKVSCLKPLIIQLFLHKPSMKTLKYTNLVKNTVIMKEFYKKFHYGCGSDAQYTGFDSTYELLSYYSEKQREIESANTFLLKYNKIVNKLEKRLEKVYNTTKYEKSGSLDRYIKEGVLGGNGEIEHQILSELKNLNPEVIGNILEGKLDKEYWGVVQERVIQVIDKYKEQFIYEICRLKEKHSDKQYRECTYYNRLTYMEMNIIIKNLVFRTFRLDQKKVERFLLQITLGDGFTRNSYYSELMERISPQAPKVQGGVSSRSRSPGSAGVDRAERGRSLGGDEASPRSQHRGLQMHGVSTLWLVRQMAKTFYLGTFHLSVLVELFLAIICMLEPTRMKTEFNKLFHSPEAEISLEEAPEAQVAALLLQFEKFLNLCVFQRHSYGLAHPFRYSFLSSKFTQFSTTEGDRLFGVFYYIVEKRVKKGKQDKTLGQGTLSITVDDFVLFLGELGLNSAQAGTPLTKISTKKIMSLLYMQDKFKSTSLLNYETAETATLTYYDFLEGLYLVSYYLNPNPFITRAQSFELFIQQMIYPVIMKKYGEFKKLFGVGEGKIMGKRKRMWLHDFDDIPFQSYNLK